MKIPDTNSPPPPDTNYFPDTFIPTGALRWNDGVLEQGFVKTNGHTKVWLPVPTIVRAK